MLYHRHTYGDIGERGRDAAMQHASGIEQLRVNGAGDGDAVRMHAHQAHAQVFVERDSAQQAGDFGVGEGRQAISAERMQGDLHRQSEHPAFS